jgi:hypothetical protein
LTFLNDQAPGGVTFVLGVPGAGPPAGAGGDGNGLTTAWLTGATLFVEVILCLCLGLCFLVWPKLPDDPNNKAAIRIKGKYFMRFLLMTSSYRNLCLRKFRRPGCSSRFAGVKYANRL